MHLVTAGVLAHEGGWDEILLVALPLVLIAGLLLIANRRAAKAVALRESETDAPDGDQPT